MDGNGSAGDEAMAMMIYSERTVSEASCSWRRRRAGWRDACGRGELSPKYWDHNDGVRRSFGLPLGGRR